MNHALFSLLSHPQVYSRSSSTEMTSSHTSRESETGDENNEEEAHQTPTYLLPNLIASMFACILDDSVNALNIIGNIGDLPRIKETIEYKTLEEKFGNRECSSYIYDPDTMEPFQVAVTKQRVIKFQRDRFYVENVLAECIRDLVTTKSFTIFVQRLDEYEKSFIEEKLLLEEARNNNFQLKQLKILLEKEKLKSTSEIQSTSECIGQLKDTYEGLIFENAVKGHYKDKWENSRFELNNISLDQKEEFYLNIINTNKIDIERETRINAEIEAYITEVQQEYEDQIQMWMETYDREIEIRDMEIQVLKETREEQFIRLEQIAKLYDEHKTEIEEFLALKQKRKEEEEFIALINRAAVKIQAWWRGTMFRKKLGPYKVKKGKKDDKGKKKK